MAIIQRTGDTVPPHSEAPEAAAPARAAPAAGVMQRLQQGAGNRGLSALVAAGATARATRAVAREPLPLTSSPDEGAPISGPTDPDTLPPATADGETSTSDELSSLPPTMPPDVALKLANARATLSRIPKMTPADQQVLALAIPGAQVVDLVARREGLRAQLLDTQVRIGSLTPAARLPDDEQATLEAELTPLGLQVEEFKAQIEQTQKLIDAIAQGLGLADEAELLSVVQDDFPKLFVARAKEIAYRQLDDNMTVVAGEAERYGLGIPGMGAGANANPADFAGKPEDLAGLRAAATQIMALDRQMELVHKTAKEERERANAEAWRNGTMTQPEEDEDIEPMLMPAPVDESTADETEELAVPLQKERDAICLQFPILYRKELDLPALTTASNDDLARMTGAQAGLVLNDIIKTKQAIKSEDLKVWNLRGIVDLTAQDLGIPVESTLMRVVDKKMAETEADEGMLKMARSALAIVAGIVATVASGGTALVAGAVAFGAAGYELHEDLKRYDVESAANDVALDPEIADISTNDPEIMPIVMDLVGLAFSAGDLGAAIKGLRQPAKMLAAGGDLVSFAKAARKFLPEAEAEAFIARAGRALGADDRTMTAIRAIGDTFRHADLGEVRALLASSSEIGFRKMFQDLTLAGHVHPLNAETVAFYMGAAGRARMEDPLLRALYDPSTKRLFIREGLSEEAFASWAVHELTHYLQDMYLAELEGFRAEYQAYKMQQSYLIGLERAAGPEAVPETMRWLINATDDAVASHVTLMYGYAAPSALERGEMLEQVMDMLGRIEG